MLARVADNLYWLGRYIERTEHLSRYLNIQYFSALDTTSDYQRDLALKSIANMVGIDSEGEGYAFEEEILVAVAMDESNQASIKSCMHFARENARGARDLISREVWNAINKFYRFINDYPEDYYKTQGLFDFTHTTIENCAIIKNRIQSTMLHDEVWAFAKMGLHIERATQITRILISKFEDIKRVKERDNKSVESFQLVTLLKSAEGLDMYHREYSILPQQKETLEFMVLNARFPRSITYNVSSLRKHILQVAPNKGIEKDSIEWNIGRMSEYLKYLTVEEFADDPLSFLNKTLVYLNDLNSLLSKEYLNH
ncbi:alpha-E domain-containing protein [Reichenbachiella agarivorans]|uniref:Alpha-E domain-containing protein n=1 Tax=Reichenbachiella agarivorans TaxID=2979464 RepID=A0ABY6CKA8_9BACT|nr:alpha-E domain-containing protein [Reichenbachiella agarivorans]UXP30956.1 alpha-E domain-containing protein [Reichenbachiella agarivorans]